MFQGFLPMKSFSKLDTGLSAFFRSYVILKVFLDYLMAKNYLSILETFKVFLIVIVLRAREALPDWFK